MFEELQISNSDLRLEDTPARPVDWFSSTMLEFALSFDGYTYWGSLARCAEMAAKEPLETLTELRMKLFFTQRAWRHATHAPSESDLEKIHNLLDEMRDRVRRNERD